jgi:hypothetical protein
MPRPDKQQDNASTVPIRSSVQPPVKRGAPAPAKSRGKAKPTCDDCRATTAFHAWHNVDLQPAFNVTVSFADWNIAPKGKRAVIELVTAEAIVPSGEWIRLRMNTSLGSVPSNLDLVLTFQGNVGDKAVYVATHSLRAYTDNEIEFTINRDNANTTGSALICISGYIAG